MTTLTTDRLTLRPPRLDDAPWIATEIARPPVQRNLTTPPHPYRLSDAEAWLAHQAELGPNGVFVIERDGPLGVVTMRRERPTEMLGYWLRIDAWGQGYMTEAVQGVLEWGFAASPEPVTSGYITGNAASCNVLTKVGFVPGEIMQRHCNFRQAEVDIQRMHLTKAAWDARQGLEAGRKTS